ncbi:MAG: SagB/ThcOx family dehydrogenase [Candidatus Omnitrophica bacterium]|nr:SagB/ThcOx family dehydrogenase [Candidatus Omnitrophota bacterium]MCG2703182.1 SagB/ThcOx family dehydrogenase [Candidatus Omnitrophota bacterium]
MAYAQEIRLPAVKTKGTVSIEETIAQRRSVRNFKKDEVNLEQISQLLWAAQGITGRNAGRLFRSAPSAGALYPMEIYIANKNGLFHYVPELHVLEEQSKNDVRDVLCTAALEQKPVREAPLVVIICAVYSRLMGKYGERGIRYAHMEAGHAAQNIQLQAVALGLGTVPIGAFNDARVQRQLSLPEDHEPLYIIPVGYAR